MSSMEPKLVLAEQRLEAMFKELVRFKYGLINR